MQTTQFHLPRAGNQAFSTDRASPAPSDSTASVDSDASRARLRLGLQMSTGLMAAVTTTFTLGVLGFAFRGDGVGRVLHTPSLWAHVGTATLLLVSALVARRTTASVSDLRTLDTAITFATGVGIALFALGKPHGMGRELVLLVFMAHVLMLRAAVVPSSCARTLALGALALTPSLLQAFWAPHATHLTAARVMPLTFTLLFGATTLAVSALISRRIYGLQRDVARAARLGQYELEAKIGEGGMGEVYRAKHALLRRPTAIKLLLPRIMSDRALARFEREVQLTSQLTHPSTVQVYDFGRSVEGTFYYAMEYIDGLTLTELVDIDGAQPAGRVARLLSQVCGSLAEAHAMGLVHRDVKPDNVLVCRRGHEPDLVKVVDFGLATAVGLGEEPDGLERVIGTPHYMAPEAVVAPFRVDARTDVYAVGALAYFLLTGTHVFDGAIDAVLAQQVHTIPERPSARLGAEVPAWLEAVVLRCLAKDPNDRPQTAEELGQLLRDGAGAWDRGASERWWAKNGDYVASQPRLSSRRAPRRITVARTRPA